MATLAPGAPAAAQQVALKGGVAVSRLAADREHGFEESITSTSIGGHLRFRFGPVAFQPEIHMVTRGAVASDPVDAEDEELRLEYLELPLLIVVPAVIGEFEPYVFGGPMVSLESRCRYVFREQGLRTNVGCRSAPLLPRRRSLDYGAVAGAGISRSLGAGRILLEARHTWGMRNIYDGAGTDEFRNRTFAGFIGYAIPWGGGDS